MLELMKAFLPIKQLSPIKTKSFIHVFSPIHSRNALRQESTGNPSFKIRSFTTASDFDLNVNITTFTDCTPPYILSF
jgi:hypothetical protein